MTLTIAISRWKPRKNCHVGGPVNPNMEQIAKLAPDLILATAINRHETVDALGRLGLPVYQVDPHSVDAMIASVEHLGEVLDAGKSATQLVENLRCAPCRSGPPIGAHRAAPRALCRLAQSVDFRLAAIRSLRTHCIIAGAQSVVDTTAEWPRVSLEEIVRLQPEFLVFANARAGVAQVDAQHSAAQDAQHDIDALRTRPGWRDLDAIRLGHIVIVSDAINRPAPRMVDAVEQLARAFHAELFTPQYAWRNAEPPRHASSDINDHSVEHSVQEVCACAR